jgi:hypothetical protein
MDEAAAKLRVALHTLPADLKAKKKDWTSSSWKKKKPIPCAIMNAPP